MFCYCTMSSERTGLLLCGVAFLISAVLCSGPQTKPTPTPAGACCQDGWVIYQSSCFYVGRDLRTYAEARAYCQSLNANLWVVNSVKEWETIRHIGIRWHWSWIGLTWKLEAPEWEGETNLPKDSLPWLTKGGDSNRGHAYALDCIALYNNPDPNGVYINWYDCRNRVYFVCEKNSTSAGSPSSSSQHISYNV